MNTTKQSARQTVGLFAVLISMGIAQNSYAFDSGSNGSDGALDFSWAAQSSTVIFDPADPMTFDGKASGRVLDPDNDNVFHFTTIKIPNYVSVLLKASKLNWKPVYWLATGDVTIGYAAYLSLNGAYGHPAGSQNEGHYPAEPGPGGFAGGGGASSINPAQPGFGPGGGLPGATDVARGGAASHAILGVANQGTAGKTYGSPFLLPIIGGSGGAGFGNKLAPQSTSVAGGGAGGGAIVIASNTRVWLDGRIGATGGSDGNGQSQNNGGNSSGSGGAIRILAPVFTGGNAGTGNPSYFDVGGNYGGGAGRVRIEANVNTYAGSFYPDSPATVRISGLVNNPPFLPTDTRIPGWPSVKVKSINGVALPAEPTASFTVPDATIDTTTAVPVNFVTENVPTNATLLLKIVSPFDGVINVNPTFTSGDQKSANWTANIAFPVNFSRGYVQATWTP